MSIRHEGDSPAIDAGIPPIAEDLSGTALLTATALLLLAGSIELVAVAGFAVGFPISPATLPLAALLAGLGTAALARSRDAARWRRSLLRALGSALLIAVGAIGIAGLIHDTTWDGNWYHQPAIMALAHGWNPLAGPPSGDAARTAMLVHYSEKADATTAAVQVNHFPKGPWYLAASLIRAGASLEQSKAFNLILIAVAALTAFAAVHALARWGTRRSALAAVLVALNPVATCQAFSFYVDGQLGSVLAALVAAGALAARAPDPAAVLAFGLAAALAINVKFSAIAYAAILAVAACCLAVRLRGLPSAAALGSLSLVALTVGALAIGWNPYVMNTLTKGHPLYPLAGPQAVDILTQNLPHGFRALNRFERLAASVFSISSNGHPPELIAIPKIPFEVYRSELRLRGGLLFASPDVRLGGFGPLFSGALVLAAILALASFASGPLAAVPWVIGALSLLISTVVSTEGWWARFAPQLWLVPLMVSLATIANRPRLTSRLSGLLLAVLAIDAGLVLTLHLGYRGAVEMAIRRELRTLRAAPTGVELKVKYFEGVRFRLAAAGVPFRVAESLSCARPRPILSSDALWCPQGRDGEDVSAARRVAP